MINKSTILTIGSIFGVVATAVACGMATVKAKNKIDILTLEDVREEPITKKECIKAVIPCYIPTVLIGVGTVACILGIGYFDRKQQAALISALELTKQSFSEYRNQLIELYGEEADQKIREECVRKYGDFHQIGVDHPDEKMWFYEPNSDSFFQAYEREIMDAEYHINRNYILRGYTTVNEFLTFLGIPFMDGGDDIGWTASDGMYWIDFEHNRKHDRKHGEYWVINTPYGPCDDEYDEFDLTHEEILSLHSDEGNQGCENYICC